MNLRIAIPVRKLGGELHLAKATGKGYRTACRRTLRGSDLDVPRAPWGRAWRLELVCDRCEQLRDQARDEAHLARLAGW